MNKLPFFKHEGVLYSVQSVATISPHQDKTEIRFHNGGQIIVNKPYKKVVEIFEQALFIFKEYGFLRKATNQNE